MNLTGRIESISIDYVSDTPKLSLVINEKNDLLQGYNDLKDCKVSIAIKKHRNKRSLDANAYCWKLISEIANILRSSKEEVYLLMLKRYGQSDMFTVRADVPIEHYCKYYEYIDEGVLKSTLYKCYIVYKGSSQYNTKEMSILIDGVVSEAQTLGIQTETPDKIAELKSLWQGMGVAE